MVWVLYPALKNPLSQYKFLLMMKNVNESCQNISANDNSICLCVKSDLYQAVVWRLCWVFSWKEIEAFFYRWTAGSWLVDYCINSDIVKKRMKKMILMRIACAKFSVYNMVIHLSCALLKIIAWPE